MLIRPIVGNQIKMLNTAAKQSPGKDANTVMQIAREEGKDGEKKELLVCSVSGDGGEDGPVFSLIVFIKASLQGNQDQLKITS